HRELSELELALHHETRHRAEHREEELEGERAHQPDAARLEVGPEPEEVRRHEPDDGHHDDAEGELRPPDGRELVARRLALLLDERGAEADMPEELEEREGEADDAEDADLRWAERARQRHHPAEDHQMDSDRA